MKDKKPVKEKKSEEVKAERIKNPEAEPKAEEAPKEEKPAKEAKPEAKKVKEQKKPSFNFKLFDKWEADVIVADQGLKKYITLTPLLVPFSQGRDIRKQFWKSDKHIVERLILKLMITGHKGKKHYHTSGHHTGKYAKIVGVVKDAFEIIEQKTKKNPLEVYIRAIEQGAPAEGVTTIEYGGVRYPKAVDLSPQRRIDLVLRWICQGAFHSKAGKGKKDSMAQLLAKQIILTAENDQAANAIQKKIETERSAAASR